jgi:hypothetical protein
MADGSIPRWSNERLDVAATLFGTSGGLPAARARPGRSCAGCSRSPFVAPNFGRSPGGIIQAVGNGLERTREPVRDEIGVRLERHPAVITDDLPDICTSIASDNPLVAGEAELREPRALPSETW